MSWKPIESAPKDGTQILLWDPTGTRELASDFSVASFKPYIQLGWFYSDAWHMVDEQCGGDCRAEPTHWQPLPEPPV